MVEIVKRYGRFLQILSGELGLSQLLSNEEGGVVTDLSDSWKGVAVVWFFNRLRIILLGFKHFLTSGDPQTHIYSNYTNFDCFYNYSYILRYNYCNIICTITSI